MTWHERALCPRDVVAGHRASACLQQEVGWGWAGPALSAHKGRVCSAPAGGALCGPAPRTTGHRPAGDTSQRGRAPAHT